MPLRITMPLLIGTRKYVLCLDESLNSASLDDSCIKNLVILTYRAVLTLPAQKSHKTA